MKQTIKIISLLLLAVLLVSCGSKKKVASSGTVTLEQLKEYKETGKLTVNKSKSGSTSNTKTTTNSKPVSTAEAQAASRKLGVTIVTTDNKKLYTEVASWLGTPYRSGGSSKSGADCSGFVYMVYQAVYGMTLSRQSSAMLTNNCRRVSKSELKEGDLVFFRTDGKQTSTPNHVGLYLKDGKFAHASTSKGVVVSELSQSYYVKSFLTGGRVR